MYGPLAYKTLDSWWARCSPVCKSRRLAGHRPWWVRCLTELRIPYTLSAIVTLSLIRSPLWFSPRVRTGLEAIMRAPLVGSKKGSEVAGSGIWTRLFLAADQSCTETRRASGDSMILRSCGTPGHTTKWNFAGVTLTIAIRGELLRNLQPMLSIRLGIPLRRPRRQIEGISKVRRSHSVKYAYTHGGIAMSRSFNFDWKDRPERPFTRVLLLPRVTREQLLPRN
ncbi:hypothetical protein C8Q72DRAFT_106071 [Fomitopsis betulina]|nr:hypothetical protein C8Q72DRAFT_106071 [Fomitopsis betulina]